MATSDGTVTYSSQELHNLGSETGTKASGVRNEFDGLMASARELASSGKWTGEMYDAFMANVENYKKEHVDPLLDTMDEFVNEINTAADETEAQTRAGVARFQ